IDLINKAFSASSEFFALDESIKLDYPRNPEKQQGYVAVNREKFNANENSDELREAYDVKRMDGMFPDEVVPAMRPAVKSLADSCIALSNRILEAMAVGLGIDRKFFTSTHKDICNDNNASCLRMLYYPPVPANVTEGSVRCGTHTDYGTITFLFQDTMGGLEVCDRNNEWVPATPIPDTILVNVGDILQFWSSDKLRATKHRVLIPSEEKIAQASRRSIVFFLHPDDPVLIKPLNGSDHYQPITAKSHVLKRFQETYQY
ncbi:unnamed protein product, partial [Meganyctiphanes norvegica]